MSVHVCYIHYEYTHYTRVPVLQLRNFGTSCCLLYCLITYQEHSLILDAVTDVGAGAGEACGGCTAPSSAGACSGKLTGFGADADAGADCRTAITACGWRVAGTAETRGLGDTEA